MKLKCTCTSARCCPMQDDPLIMFYPDGSPVYRMLTPEEQANARLTEAEGDFDLREPEPGDFVVEDDDGDSWVTAKAIDVERALQFTMAQVGRKCKGASYMWRMKNP